MRRLLLVVVLVIVGLALLPACASAPTHPAHAGDVRALEVHATVGPDGVISVGTVAFFAESDGGTLHLRAPALGTIDVVTVGGSSRSAAGGDVRIDVPDARARIAYRISGAAERYRDVTQIELPVWSGVDGITRLAAPGIPIELRLTLPDKPTGPIIWHGVTGARGLLDTGRLVPDGVAMTYALRADIVPARSSAVVVTLPSAATPGLPILRDEDRADYLDGRQSAARAADARLARDVGAARDRARLIDGGYWALVGLCVVVPILITLLRVARAARRRVGATRDVPSVLRDAPDDLRPATVGLLAAGGHDISTDAAAATILLLATRKALTITNTGGGAWRIDLTSPSPELDPAEAAVVNALRGAATGVTLTGPPLAIGWDPWWKGLRIAAVAEARARGLLARRYPSGLFVTAVILLTALTTPLWFRSPEKAAAGAAVAVILVALPFVGGYVLTPTGHTARAQWMAYGRHIREHGDLGDVDPAGVTIWGPYLAYGAALGEAPAAAHGLTPPGTPSKATRPIVPTVASTALLLMAVVLATITAGAGQPAGAAAQAEACPIGSKQDFRRANPSGRVIQRRMAGINLSCQDLSGFNFGQADMHGANLSRARLDKASFGQSDIAGANFTEASMVEAELIQATSPGARYDRANLTDARMTQATLTDAKLPGATLLRAELGQAHLERVDFTGANLQEVDFTQAELAGAVLAGANLAGVAPEDVAEANRAGTPFAPVTSSAVPECRVGSKGDFAATVLDKTERVGDLDGIDLSCQDLTGLRFFASDISGTKLAKAKLSGTELVSVDMTGLDLRQADLSGAELSSAKLARADLRGTNLSRTKLTSADLTKADARGANFERADLSSAKLDETDLSGASIKSATLTFASARGAVWEDADLAGAKGISTMRDADLAGAEHVPASQWLRWLLGIGAVLVLAVVVAVLVRRSRGIAAET